MHVITSAASYTTKMNLITKKILMSIVTAICNNENPIFFPKKRKRMQWKQEGELCS